MKADSVQIELVQDRVLTGVVCCNINPNSKDAFKRVDMAARTIHNGTKSSSWTTIKADDALMGKHWGMIKPLPCSKNPGFWHYVVTI